VLGTKGTTARTLSHNTSPGDRERERERDRLRERLREKPREGESGRDQESETKEVTKRETKGGSQRETEIKGRTERPIEGPLNLSLTLVQPDLLVLHGHALSLWSYLNSHTGTVNKEPLMTRLPGKRRALNQVDPDGPVVVVSAERLTS
jgi:hypothetical protein